MKATTDAGGYAGHDKCVSRPGSCGEVLGTLAAMRVAVQEALACVEVHMAAFERLLEQEVLVAAAAASKGPKAEEDFAEASG